MHDLNQIFNERNEERYFLTTANKTKINSGKTVKIRTSITLVKKNCDHVL